jgi:hypothetical protein
MDQVSLNIKLVRFSWNFVCKNDLISNLRAQIFIVCKKTIYKNE